MNKLLLATALSLSVYGCSDASDQQNTAAGASSVPTLTQQWETPELRVPESVLYHESEGERFLLVSEIEGDGTKADGQGGIAKLSLSGEIINQDWVRGLHAPKGMGVHGGKLYVADLHDVAVIDMASQTVELRIPVADAVFLNDIAVDDTGVVYVSDTRTNKVHRIIDNTAEVYLEDIEGANGLTTIGSDLYIGANDTLWKVDANKKVTEVTDDFEENADGVEMIKPNEFLVSCWKGIIYHVDAEGEVTTVLDTREAGSNTADIGWNPVDKILYVPTFLKHSVVAYQL